MLEMILALAFRSLPEELLAEYCLKSRRLAKVAEYFLDIS